MQRYISEDRPKFERRPSDLLFLSRTGKPMERIGLWDAGRKARPLQRFAQKHFPHTLRHCFASHLLGAAGPTFASCRNCLATATSTLPVIYTHVDHTRLKAVHEKFHPRN